MILTRNIILVLLFWMVMVGCSERERAVPFKPTPEDFKPVCLDGVQYFSSYYSGGYILTPRFNVNSEVELCIGEWKDFDEI